MERVDWRECVNWMIDIGFLSPDHELTKDSSNLSDLAFFLRDGVALCHLLNKITPGCLDRSKFCPLSESQFSSANNLRTFQECCVRTFLIPNSFCFDSNKFVRLEAIGDVLRFLSELSKRSRTQTGVKAFTVKASTYYNFTCTDTKNLCTFPYIKMEDDIYSIVMNSFDQREKKTRTVDLLQYCVDELLDTEKNYIAILELIDKKFSEPLKGVMDEKSFKMIFLEIKPLLRIHKSFYTELCKSTEDDWFLDIADIFIKFKEKFLIYGHYCKKLKSVLELLDSLRSSSEVIKACLKASETSHRSKSFMLHEYLTIPMQRVLKYPLILKEMMKRSKTKPLEKAIEETQDLACFVNEVTRDHDILGHIEQLQTTISGLPSIDLKSCGRTVKDGEIYVKTSTRSKMKMRHIFLFDNNLMICKPKHGNFGFRFIYDTIDFISDDIQNKPSKILKLRKPLYQCILKRSDNLHSLILISKNKHELTTWATAIRNAKDNSSPKHSNSPNRVFQLTTFPDVEICDVCKKLLKGLFCQGYYCSDDKIASHKDCLFMAQEIDKMGKSYPKPLKLQSRSCTNINSYINSDFKSQPWYMGEMSREIAFKLMDLFKESTFFIRKSTSKHDNYCINIKYSGKIQNIKIHKKDNKFFLSELKQFSNLVELVSYYETNSLKLVFRQLKTNLGLPIKDTPPLDGVPICKALQTIKIQKADWLDLKEGDLILLVEKTSPTIWQGFLDGELGKFYSTSVEVLERQIK